jgi:hypothetical protein
LLQNTISKKKCKNKNKKNTKERWGTRPKPKVCPNPSASLKTLPRKTQRAGKNLDEGKKSAEIRHEF